MVIAVRGDLKLSRGKLAAQVAHAAVSCALRAQKHDRREFRNWFDEGQRKVTVRCPDEPALHTLQADARAAGLTTGLVRDAGRTELAAGTITCLGIGPAGEAELDRLTGNLPLL
ncbi:MAG: aminoacyl-tRNA hydrolase [Methanobacteriota archaeon]|nr:MAG: aminoacyl-tRNA hydrolase [Euryarchaeota archaeon]HIN08541.1 peptidyl-tRNA hydrolase [Candidatus Poseidoniales archaeon]